MGAEAQAAVIQLAKDGATNATLWLALAKIIYTEITKNSPFNNAEMESYQELCGLYKACNPPANNNTQTKIPDQWMLDKDNRPLHTSDYTKIKSDLRQQLELFNGCHHSQKTLISGMVANLIDLFISLSKRAVHKYRPDGFESMFLTELALWLVIDLPRYNIHEEATEQSVQRRIDYCNAVQKKVLVYYWDEDKANAKNILPGIIEELECMVRYLRQTHQAAHFSTKIDAINRHMQGMVEDTFNILFGMLKGEARQELFQVREFLTPSIGRAEKLAPLRASLLGQWITQTCNVAGIKSNDYQSAEQLTYKIIEEPIKIPQLTNIKNIGCHDFVWRTNFNIVSGPNQNTQAEIFLKNEADSFLTLVINLHRSILRLSYIRNALMEANQINIVYGEAWLFNAPEGRAMFEGLIEALKHANEKHIDAVGKFWTAFYTNKYEPYVQKEKLDKKNATFAQMTKTEGYHTNNIKKKADIDTKIAEIHQYADKAQDRMETNQQTKQRLIGKITEYLAGTRECCQEKLNALLAVKDKAPAAKPNPDPAKTPNITQAELDHAKNTHFNTVGLLCVQGGYSEPPKRLYNAVYQFLLQSPTDISDEQRNQLKKDYNAALAEAVEHKLQQKATLAAAKLKQEQEQIQKAATPIPTSTSVATPLGSFTEAEIRDTVLSAIVTVTQQGFNDLTNPAIKEHLDNIYNCLALTNPKVDITEEQRKRYIDLSNASLEKFKALADAAKQQQTLAKAAKKKPVPVPAAPAPTPLLNQPRGNVMPDSTPTSTTTTTTTITVDKSKMPIVCKVALFFAKTVGECTDEYLPVTTIKSPQNLKGLPLMIYENILKEYASPAESFWWGIAYSTDKKLLRTHLSRLTRALSIIAETNSIDLLQRDPIDAMLTDELRKMFGNLHWIIAERKSMYDSVSNDKALEITGNGDILLLAPKLIVNAVNAEASAKIAEAEKKAKAKIAAADKRAIDAEKKATKADKKATEADRKATDANREIEILKQQMQKLSSQVAKANTPEQPVQQEISTATTANTPKNTNLATSKVTMFPQNTEKKSGFAQPGATANNTPGS